MFTNSGTNGNDSLEGTDADATIYGLDGNDTLSGGAWTRSGNNLLDGGNGNYFLIGQEGATHLLEARVPIRLPGVRSVVQIRPATLRLQRPFAWCNSMKQTGRATT